MIIDRFNKTTTAESSTLWASLHWEESDHPMGKLYFQAPAAFTASLSLTPEAFLVAALLPAIHFGEKRIRVDGAVCPELMDGLSTAMALFHAWYGEHYQPIPIQCSKAWAPREAPPPPRAAVFLSGGVDSLAILRENHRRLPHGHPDRYQDGIFIHGHDIGGIVAHGAEEDIFKRALHTLEKIASECSLTLIPINTNTRNLCDDHQFWMRVFYAAALSAVGHTLTHRIDRISIGSGNVINHLRPWGSTPVLDPCYSSSNLQVRHAGLHHTRLKRVQWVSQWPIALANLRVCGHNPVQPLNCGACEKCVRTMTQLAAVGKLAETDAFPVKDVTAKMIQQQLLIHDYQLAPYRDVLPLLVERKRNDLVRAIRAKLFKYHYLYRFLEGVDLKLILKRIDQRWFKGAFLERYRQIKQGQSDAISHPRVPSRDQDVNPQGE